jgi:hypothetical protein
VSRRLTQRAAAGFTYVDSGFWADKSEWQSVEGKRFDSLRAHSYSVCNPFGEQFTNPRLGPTGI